MLQEIKKWKSKLQAGVEEAEKFLSLHGACQVEDKKKIAFFGMGGSGIAGKIVSLFLDRMGSRESLSLATSYLPFGVDNQTLTIVTSYSGNTWETLAIFDELCQKQLPVIAVTHGGKLKERASHYGIPCITVPESSTPRSALPSFLGIFFTLMNAWKLLDGKRIVHECRESFENVASHAQDESYFDEFLSCAQQKEFFLVWGVSGDSDAAIYRAQTQFNENSKMYVLTAQFPELCHNLLNGFFEARSQPLILIGHTDFMTHELATVIALSREIVHNHGANLYKIPVFGDTWAKQFFSLILWSDFASSYLAHRRGVPVVPVPLIEDLKHKLKNKGF